MYLSSLDIHGFKSFATATELRFDSGITAIVGPNGSGKSNIVDALRWVIGEQRVRILRSDKMNNIIFNGSAKRRPLGMAEVQLTIENSRQVLPVEYTEITIGRRVYRSGEAEYLLNGTPCRLRDIQDLFSDTGMGAGAYSVIELKMIDEILSDKTQDRRRLFEEAAGLTKYKQRRSQAIRKLEITQADLARVYDLTEEISRRVSSLKRQAATAARYRRYRDRARVLDYTLLQLEREGLEADGDAINSNMQRYEDELTRWISRTSIDEATVESLRSTLIAAENAAGANQKAFLDHQTHVTRLEADLALNQEKQLTINRDRKRLDEEQAADQGRASDLVEEARRLGLELNDAETAAETAKAALAEAARTMTAAREKLAAHQDALREQRSHRQRYSESLSQHSRELDRSENRKAWLDEERKRLERSLKSLEVQGREVGQRLTDARSKRTDQYNAWQAAQEKYEADRKKHDDLSNSVSEITRRLNDTGRNSAARAAEIEMLEALIASREDFPDGVRFLIEDGVSGSVRTVSDVVTCAPKHHAALAAALGEYGACIIVRSRKDAFELIRALQSASQGRILTVALDEIKSSPSAARAGGHLHSALRDNVRVLDDECATLIDLLLHNVYCVDSLAQAEIQSNGASGPAARFVTPAGEWLDGKGFMHGGGQARAVVEEHLQRRDSLEQTRQDQGRLESLLESLGNDRDKLNQHLIDLDIASVGAAVHAAEQGYRSAQEQVHRFRDEHEALEKQLNGTRQRLGKIQDDIIQVQRDIREFRERTSSAASEHTRAREMVHESNESLGRLQNVAQKAQDEFASRNAEAIEARTRHETLQRDLARVRSAESELTSRVERRKRDSVLLEAGRATLEQETEELQESIRDQHGRRDGLDKRVHGDKNKIMRLRVDLKQVEDRLRKLRRGREAAQKQVTEHQMKQVEVRTRLTDVNRRIAECGELESIADEELTEDAMRKERNELRSKMQGMGRVNALALEEYEKEKERLDFMESQCTDLQDAESTLNQTISEINVAATRRFMDVFDIIRNNFQELFEELFGAGATCDLVLPDADDILESPIDIMAKPRGKRPVGITQLSSGEKTLTAIALLFAIYMVKPSPFCFLDEVDAPLDDANIDRYMRLIRRFAVDTQFILVTHNKRTMEMADRLYGITMQEQGVSSMVGVQFEQALAIAGNGA